MRVTRKQLRKLVETIYVGQKLPDAELERVDDDGKIVPASPVAIVGGDSGDNMQSSLENIAQGLGTSPEVSQNLAKIIKLFSSGASEVLKGNNDAGIVIFVQAWSLLDSLEIDLDFDGSLLTIFLDALSGSIWGSKPSPGKVIDPKVFDAFRASILFGELVSMTDEVNALRISGQTGNIDPMFVLIKDRLHPKLFPLFTSGYNDAVNSQGTAALDQFVSLGLANYDDGSYENFMIQILIAPYELILGGGNWKGIDYVTNLLIKEMYTAASIIKSAQRYSGSKVTSRDDSSDYYKTGKSSISLPDTKSKFIDPKSWDKKRRGVDYDIHITIPAREVFPEYESFEEISVQAAQYVYDNVLSSADDSYSRWMSERPYDYPEIFDAYEEFYETADMQPYEDALIKGALWKMFKQSEGRLYPAGGSPFSSDNDGEIINNLEVIKFEKTKKYKERWEIAPDDITIHLRYTGSEEGGVSPGEVIGKIKQAMLNFAPSTHDASGAINIHFIEALLRYSSDQSSKDYHVVSDGQGVSEEYSDYNPINYIKHSWLPDDLEDLDDIEEQLYNDPNFLVKHAKNLTKKTLDLNNVAKIRIFAKNKSADKVDALKKAEEEKRKQRFREGISRAQLKTLIRQAVLKRIL